MKKRIRNTCAMMLASLMLPLSIEANNSLGYYMNYSNYIVSPHVADMYRYGDIENSLFTGRLNMSIPIYSLNDPDFQLDIALRYNSEGFKPRKHAGYVGYSWFLEAGGCITREIENYPDELFQQHPQETYYAEGMLHFSKQHVYSPDQVFNLTDSTIYEVCGACGYNIGNSCKSDVDYMPDIFRFNFHGYQGTFIINNRGKPVIFEGDFVEINVSRLTDNSSLANANTIPFPNDSSRITIRTMDGYTYVFGGNLSCLEYSVDAVNGQTFVNMQNLQRVWNPAVSTWYLSQVIAPNGRTLTYYYKPTHNERPTHNDNLWEFNEAYDRFAVYYNSVLLDNQLIDYYNSIRYSYSMTKLCVLDSIRISGLQTLRIEFHNSIAQRKMYNHPSCSLDRPNYQLDSICVIAADRTIKRAHLSYFYNSCLLSDNTHSYNWRFLQSVHISGIGAYLLNYYQPSNYPSLLNPGNSYLQTEADEYGYWLGHPLQGLLSQVVFPTGGRQTYTYGSHHYSKIRRYSLYGENHIQMNVEDADSPLSGVRLEEVRTFINDSLVERKTYTYNGGIYHNNLYIFGLPVSFSNGFPVRYRGNYSLLDSPIFYENVTENTILSDDETYKVKYTFSVGENSYNSIFDENVNHYVPDGDWRTKSTYIILNGVLLYNSKLTRHGKLLSKEIYKGTALVQSIQSVYNGTDAQTGGLNSGNAKSYGCHDTIAVFSHYNASYVSKKLFVYPDLLEQVITNNYFEGGQQSSTITEYIYDSKYRKKRETITDSNQQRRFSNYTYPDDIAGDYDVFTNHPYALLAKSKRICEPVEVISGYENDGHDTIIAGRINLYKNGTYVNSFYPANNNCAIPSLLRGGGIPSDPLPDSLEIGEFTNYPYLHKTMVWSSVTGASDYVPLSFDGTNPHYDSRYKMVCEYDFNRYLRPIRIAPYGLFPTIYTWDGIYPSSITNGHQTTSYTYIPYVGIRSVTNARGITTWYEYDTNGKLIEVYQLHDGRKEILNSYIYHIQSE